MVEKLKPARRLPELNVLYLILAQLGESGTAENAVQFEQKVLTLS